MESHIDLTLAISDIASILEWDTMKDLHSSDDFPIRVQIRIATGTPGSDGPDIFSCWNVRKANWEDFQQHLDFRFDEAEGLRRVTLSSHVWLTWAVLCYFAPRFVFNPRPVRAFLITRTVRGGGGTTPWRSAPDCRRASRKRPLDASRRDLAIAHIVFSPRSTFDLVKSGQMSNVYFKCQMIGSPWEGSSAWHDTSDDVIGHGLWRSLFPNCQGGQFEKR